MRWIRIWTEETLEGSTFEEMGNSVKMLAFRGIWFSLITLAGNSSIPGKICFTEKTGYGLNQLSDKLKINEKLLEEALVFLSSKEIDKIKITKSNNELIIKITNWSKYQTEYERQKKYRNKGFKKGYNKRLQQKVTTKGYKEKLQTDEDEDEDEEKDEEKDKNNIYIGILNFWNSKKIIVHKQTDELLESIEKIIKKKKYKKDNIIQAIKNYSIVLDDKKYFFKYIWSLENFLSRGKALTSFLKGGESWENYKQQNKDKKINWDKFMGEDNAK